MTTINKESTSVASYRLVSIGKQLLWKVIGVTPRNSIMKCQGPYTALRPIVLYTYTCVVCEGVAV